MPIEVPRSRRGWPEDVAGSRASAASEFSGTNVHVVIESASRVHQASASAERPLHLMTVSARTPTALRTRGRVRGPDRRGRRAPGHRLLRQPWKGARPSAEGNRRRFPGGSRFVAAVRRGRARGRPRGPGGDGEYGSAEDRVPLHGAGRPVQRHGTTALRYPADLPARAGGVRRDPARASRPAAARPPARPAVRSSPRQTGYTNPPFSRWSPPLRNCGGPWGFGRTQSWDTASGSSSPPASPGSSVSRTPSSW
jgi:hypothetical protein